MPSDLDRILERRLGRADFLRLGVVLGGTGLLAACGGSSSESAPPPPPPAGTADTGAAASPAPPACPAPPPRAPGPRALTVLELYG
jgi:hypothetical protein